MNQNNNITVIVLALGAIFSLAPLAIDMYLPALPTMAVYFGTSIDSMEATVAVFLLGYAISQLILGPVSDIVGRMPVLFGGLILFTIASLMIALSSTTGELYLYRFLQALGGGSSVTVFAFVNDRFDQKQSAQIISYIMAVVAIAPLIAPVIVGEVLIAYGWQWIFFGLSAYALLVLTLTGVVFGSDVKTAPVPESQKDKPLKNIASAHIQVLANRKVLAHIFTGSFAFAGLFAFIAGSPFVYIDYFGINPGHYGYFVAANASVMILLNVINAKFLANINSTQKMLVASKVLGLVSILMLIASNFQPPIELIALGTASFIGLLGLISANAIAGALSTSRQHGGTVSALYGVTQFTLGAISSGIVSAITSTDASTMLIVMSASGLLALVSALTLNTPDKQVNIHSEA